MYSNLNTNAGAGIVPRLRSADCQCGLIDSCSLKHRIDASVTSTNRGVKRYPAKSIRHLEKHLVEVKRPLCNCHVHIYVPQ